MTAIVATSFRRSSVEPLHIYEPASGQGPESKAMAQRLQDLIDRAKSTPSVLTVETCSVEQRLFDALSTTKMLTSKVAMHMDQEWRKRLFAQLDALHDPDDWDDADEPVSEKSFLTFLRTMLLLRPSRRPGLSLANGGHLVGAWTEGKDRLTIEFLAGDQVRWVLVRYLDGDRESAAGTTYVSRLRNALASYDPQHWLSGASS